MKQTRLPRTTRHRRIRSHLKGSAARPRASVFRSNRTMTVQLIDDDAQQTLLAVVGKPRGGVTKVALAQQVGTEVAQMAKAKGITQIVFDRGGWAYHGRVQALAEALRAGGLDF